MRGFWRILHKTEMLPYPIAKVNVIPYFQRCLSRTTVLVNPAIPAKKSNQKPWDHEKRDQHSRPIA